ncbi:MAG: FliA/WhiG family RNA polymerase sigma factor [bacterium]
MNSEDLVREFVKSQNPTLREQVIVRYLPVVKYVIARLNLSVRNKTELEDIHSAGIMGLLRALDDYDVSRNTAFKTYATWRVRGSILDYLRKIDFISRGDRAKLRKIEQTIADLSFRFGREPSAFEVANELGMDLRECHRLLEVAQLNFTISLDQTQNLDGEELRLSDIIADRNSSGPFEQLSRKNILNLVKEAIFKLPERQRLIVLMYYHDEMTLLEIGKVLNLSESRISRLLGKAILSIRNDLKTMKVHMSNV